jgi:hypothetical protein
VLGGLQAQLAGEVRILRQRRLAVTQPTPARGRTQCCVAGTEQSRRASHRGYAPCRSRPRVPGWHVHDAGEHPAPYPPGSRLRVPSSTRTVLVGLMTVPSGPRRYGET